MTRTHELEPVKIRWTREEKRPDALTRFVARWKLRDARCVLLHRNHAFRGPPLVYASRTRIVFAEVDLAMGLNISGWGVIDLKGLLLIRVPTEYCVFTPRVNLRVLVDWEAD